MTVDMGAVLRKHNPDASRHEILARINDADTRVNADVIVVGAGLSGLTTAYRLQRAGLAVEVREAAARAGGVIGSERRDGVLFERGPNSGLDTTPLINEMLRDLGIAGERIDGSAASSKRYVLRGGRTVALPTSAGAFLGTPLFSAAAKLRLFAEPFIARAAPDSEESIAGFVRRRLGQEFLDYAIEPFVAGIYAGDPEQLSVPAAFPRLHALEQRYGSLLKGALLGARERRKSSEKAKNMAPSFSFAQGMQTLTDTLAAALPAVRYGHRVTALTQAADGRFVLAGEAGGQPWSSSARAVVLAVPAYAASEIVGPLAPAAARALDGIVYPPVAVVASAYRRQDVAHPLDGFGFLAPRVEQPAVLGTLFSSSMFEGRAPQDTVLLTSFVGGRRSPAAAAAPDQELCRAVDEELARLLGTRRPPLWNEVTRWPRAIPQYALGHRQRLTAVEAAETEWPGLYFCANYRGGVSISDCIKSAHATADRVAGQLLAAAKPAQRSAA
jgi:protoporphyrinogen/coproporphyrinogen III oxidase